MVNVKVIGVNEARRFLGRENKKKLDLVNDAIHKAGFFLEGEVKESVAGRRAEVKSVDTGNFLRSVNTDNTKKLVSIVRDETSYGKFLEFGTSRLRPRRHFRNSADRNRKKIVGFVRKSIK